MMEQLSALWMIDPNVSFHLLCPRHSSVLKTSLYTTYAPFSIVPGSKSTPQAKVFIIIAPPKGLYLGRLPRPAERRGGAAVEVWAFGADSYYLTSVVIWMWLRHRGIASVPVSHLCLFRFPERRLTYLWSHSSGRRRPEAPLPQASAPRLLRESPPLSFPLPARWVICSLPHLMWAKTYLFQLLHKKKNQ